MAASPHFFISFDFTSEEELERTGTGTLGFLDSPQTLSNTQSEQDSLLL